MIGPRGLRNSTRHRSDTEWASLGRSQNSAKRRAAGEVEVRFTLRWAAKRVDLTGAGEISYPFLDYRIGDRRIRERRTAN